MNEILQDVGALPPGVKAFVADHVEMKVAADMRDGDVDAMVLVINKAEGPCDAVDGNVKPASCRALVAGVLPEDATLTVWWRPEAGTMTSATFTGDDA